MFKLLVFVMVIYHASGDTEEHMYRYQEDLLYQVVCRYPTELVFTIEEILSLEKKEYSVIPDQKVLLRRCSTRHSFCPTLSKSQCVSIRIFETEKLVAFELMDGRVASVSVKEHGSCRCSC